MKKVFILSLLCLISYYGYSQKVNVAIVSTRGAAISEWQILDENYLQVIPGSEYPGDSIIFSLEANKHYFLQVSIINILIPGVPVYSVLIDNQPVMSVGSEADPGDYFYPFFTGIREVPSKIIGGSSISISMYPWQVFLISGNYQCGGSMISRDWVVTAAHCVYGTAPSAITVIAGATNPYSSGDTYHVSDVIVHSSYNSTTYAYDIALLKVTSSMNCTYCTPIRLMNSLNALEGATDPGVMATITGWGLTSISPKVLPQNLQVAIVPIVSNSVASQVWGSIPSTDIMAGYLDGNKDACSGDSGGPMSVYVNGEYRQAGIVSWGSKNCDTYGAYTKVSALEPWIREKTSIVDFAPSIPSGDSVVCPGTSTSYYSTNTIAGTVTYQWALYPAIAGTLSYTLKNASVDWTPGYTGRVYVKVRATVNGSLSEWAIRTVNLAVNTVISSQPKDTAVCDANSAWIQVAATGTLLNYDWYKDGTLYQSGVSNQVYFLEPHPESSGTFRCKVSGLCGTLLSNNVTLNVYPLTVISSFSPDITANYGDNLNLAVDASGHDLNYKWIKNGFPVENNNSPELVMLNVDAHNIGLYNTIVTGTCGTLISDSSYVYLKQSDAASAPRIFIWPTVVTDEVNVAMDNSNKYDIRIVSLSGKLMFSSLNRQYQSTIPLGNYPKGIYILNVRGNNISKSVKFVKE
jgi:trypsin